LSQECSAAGSCGQHKTSGLTIQSCDNIWDNICQICVVTSKVCCAGGGYWLYKRRSAGSFERFDKFDSGAAAGPMQGGGAANVFATSKFGSRMVYPDMQVRAHAACPHLRIGCRYG